MQLKQAIEHLKEALDALNWESNYFQCKCGENKTTVNRLVTCVKKDAELSGYCLLVCTECSFEYQVDIW